MPEELDHAFGILTVGSIAASYLLLLVIVCCSTVYVFVDARARNKSIFQALIWSLTCTLVPPLGLYIYLWIHLREGPTGITPPLVSLRGLIISSVVFLILFFGVNPAIILPVTNVGSSMEPTLEEGDRLVGDRFAVRLGALRRRDVVLLRDLDGDLLVKRIIGLPGETINVQGGQTRVNGQALEEPYTLKPPRYFLPPLRVPDDTYYVLGDNRNVSVDSHYFGPVPRTNILAKVRYRFWPLPRVSIIR
jgi:signal peptidase I